MSAARPLLPPLTTASHPRPCSTCRQALLDSVDRLPALADKTITGGRLNVSAALAALRAYPAALPEPAFVTEPGAQVCGGQRSRPPLSLQLPSV